MICRPGYAGSGVAPCRLKQYLVGLKLGQLFAYLVVVGTVGDNEYVFGINQRQYVVVAHLQERTSCAEEVYELFRLACAAVGPETATYATAHDHAISVG